MRTNSLSILVAILVFASVNVIAQTITWSPQFPQIGQTVVITLEDFPWDVERTTWYLGGAGCDGANSIQECIPSPFNDCKTIAYEYTSSGSKEIEVVARYDAYDYPYHATLAVDFGGTCNPDTEICTNVVLEPGFEGGSGSAWSESSTNAYYLITMNRPRTGSFSAWLGGVDNEAASLWQTPFIDPEAVSATLGYWYWIESDDYCGYDNGGVTINGQIARYHDYDLCHDTWEYVQSEIVDLLPLAGTSPEIRFFANTDEGKVSSLFIDDVVLQVCVPGSSSEGQIFADGFEEGNTAGWSSTAP